MSLSPLRWPACLCRGRPCNRNTPVVWPAEPMSTCVCICRRDPSAAGHMRREGLHGQSQAVEPCAHWNEHERDRRTGEAEGRLGRSGEGGGPVEVRGMKLRRMALRRRRVGIEARAWGYGTDSIREEHGVAHVAEGKEREVCCVAGSSGRACVIGLACLHLMSMFVFVCQSLSPVLSHGQSLSPVPGVCHWLHHHTCLWLTFLCSEVCVDEICSVDLVPGACAWQ